MKLQGKAIEPIISIKRSEPREDEVSNIPIKCPECGRKTMINNKCDRCGYVNRRNRMMII